MKNTLIHTCMACTLLLTACGNNQETVPAVGTTWASENHMSEVTDMYLTAGGQVYQARFYDNETAEALMERIPMELDMQELHGNEKYYYLPDSLPTDTENIRTIHAGDIMLFGSDCLVLFYEDVQTTFSYTRIGYLEEPAGLSDTLGSGSVKVKFDRAE